MIRNFVRSFVVFVALAVFVINAYSRDMEKPYHEEIGGYVEFIKKDIQSPTDYIISKFEKNDIVILCERAHPELTQYDMIFSIVSDERFISDIGHVYTEIGTSSLESYIEAFLMNDTFDEKDVKKHLDYIYQNLSINPMWEKPNLYYFLRKVYYLNRTLPVEKKIHVHTSDQPFEWEGMTSESYRAFYKTVRNRDKVMADQIIENFDRIAASPEIRKKALVIMNYRHAFPHFEFSKRGQTRKIMNTGGYLLERYPGKVSNVLINTIKLLAGSSDSKVNFSAIQDGKWDAAFQVLGNPSAGLDFKDSPFGADGFDLLPIDLGQTYEDNFTGFVFYKPLDAHVMAFGVPEIFVDGFEEELSNRYRIRDEKMSDEDIKKEIESLKTLEKSGYEKEEVFGISDYKKKIQNWLK